MKIILRMMVSLHTVARDKMQGLLGAGGPVWHPRRGSCPDLHFPAHIFYWFRMVLSRGTWGNWAGLLHAGHVATSDTLAQLRLPRSTAWILPWQFRKGTKNVMSSLKLALRHTCHMPRCIPSVRSWRGTGARGNIRKQPFARSALLSNFKMVTRLLASKRTGDRP